MFNRNIISMHTDWDGEYVKLNAFSHYWNFSSCVLSIRTSTKWCCCCHTVEVGLSLLATTSMPLKYWDQAFLTDVHLINRTPSKLLNYDTSLHRLLGATPDYSSILVFGCACWPNLRPYNSHKHQFRPICCVFLGIIICTKAINVLIHPPGEFIFHEMLSWMKPCSLSTPYTPPLVHGIVMMSFFQT